MPFDNIKTRIQSSGHVHNGMLDCAAGIAQREGIRAFWRGTTPRLMRLMVSGFARRMVILADLAAVLAFKRHNIHSVCTGRSICELKSPNTMAI